MEYLKNNSLRIISALLVLAFFLLFFTPWYAVKQFDVSITYTASQKTLLQLAGDHQSDLFNREKLIFSQMELPETDTPAEVTVSGNSVFNNLRGVRLELTTPGEMKITSLKITGRKKSYQADFAKDLVIKDDGLKISGTSLLLSGKETVNIPIALPMKLKVARKLQIIPFILSLLASLIPAGFFYRQIKIPFSKEKIPPFIFAAGVLALMLFPLLGIDRLSKVSEENRFLQTFPSFADENGINTKFPREFEDFLNDRFQGRESMIERNSELFSFNWLDFSGEKHAADPNLIFYGRENWLFSPMFDTIPMIQNKNRFSEAELQRCAMRLEELAKLFKERFNAPVYLVLMPDKERVYEDYYPGYLLKQRTHKQSRLEQLARYIQANTQVKVIYPLPELLKRKKEHLLYYPAGTHQTLRGGFFCAQEIKRVIAEDFPEIADAPDNIARWEIRKKADLDIAGLMGITDPEKSLPKEFLYHPEPVFHRAYGIHGLEKIPQLSLYINLYKSKLKSAEKGLRILAVTDSFWGNVAEFMNPVFKEQLHAFYGDGRDFVFAPFLDRVEKFRPQAVIIESTERFLHRFLTIRYGE